MSETPANPLAVRYTLAAQLGPVLFPGVFDGASRPAVTAACPRLEQCGPDSSSDAAEFEQVVEDRAEGRHRERQVALMRQEMATRSGHVSGQPAAVIVRHHAIGAALPDGN